MDVNRYFKQITLDFGGSKWFSTSRTLDLDPEGYLIVSVSSCSFLPRVSDQCVLIALVLEEIQRKMLKSHLEKRRPLFCRCHVPFGSFSCTLTWVIFFPNW